MSALRDAIVRAARRTRAGGDVPRAARPGDGFAFDRVRGFVDGDDPRRIDWSATARTGELQTRVYLEETGLVLGAVIDGSPSMDLGRRRPLRDAAAEALGAWCAAAGHADAVRRVVDERIVAGPRAAVEARASGPFDLRRTLELALRALPAGASLLLVTDALDPLDDDVLVRAGRRFDATVLLARDPWLDGLPLRGFVRVRDVESGRTRRLAIGPRTRVRYRRASVARDARLRARFARAGWRVGAIDERDGAVALARAFGVV